MHEPPIAQHACLRRQALSSCNCAQPTLILDDPGRALGEVCCRHRPAVPHCTIQWAYHPLPAVLPSPPCLLLRRYPGAFSRGLVGHAGPSQQQMEATSTTFDLFAAGYSSPPPPGVAAGKPDKHVSAATYQSTCPMACSMQLSCTTC
jgi:hypothetical protein